VEKIRELSTKDLEEKLWVMEHTSFEWPLGLWPSASEIREELERRKLGDLSRSVRPGTPDVG
jgi:hypothetical protein